MQRLSARANDIISLIISRCATRELSLGVGSQEFGALILLEANSIQTGKSSHTSSRVVLPNNPSVRL